MESLRPRHRCCEDDPTARHSGMTLLVAGGMEGFDRGRNLEKIGNHSQDTAALFFDDVRIPVANRMGEEGEAFGIFRRTLLRNDFRLQSQAWRGKRTELNG